MVLRRKTCKKNEFSYSAAHLELMEVFSKHVDRFTKWDKFHFIAYNAKFDYDFMREFFLRCGDKFFGSWFHFPYRDIMQLAGEVFEADRPHLPNFKLETLASHLCLNIEAHKAESDIEVTRKIHKILRERIKKEKP